MSISIRKARRALLVVLGFAATVTIASDQSAANDNPLMQALELSEEAPTQAVEPVTYNALSALDSHNSAVDEVFEGFAEELEETKEAAEKALEAATDSTIVHSGSSKSTMKVVGRVHVDAWGFDTEDDFSLINQTSAGNPLDPQNRLGFRRMRFGVRGDVKDNMEYRIEMEFAGGNDSEFRDAWLGWKNLPFFQKVLLGNQKRPYGLDHLNSSRFNVFIERPFVIEAINQDARRLGLAAYGVSEDEAWNWRYGVYNQRNIQSLGNYIDDHLQLEVTGRLANTIWYDETSDGRGYAHWAISGTHADSTTNTQNGNEARFRTRPEGRSSNRWIDTGRIPGADHFEMLGLESVVNVGALQVVAEYQTLWLDRNGFNDTHFDGGYVYASYFLTGEHMPWSRSSGTLARIVPFQNFWVVDRCDGCRDAGWGAWQIAARYSVADFNDEDIFGGRGEAWTFGLNWYWNPNARMQFNYITGEIENRDVNPVGAAGAPVTLNSGDYNIYGARFMIDF